MARGSYFQRIAQRAVPAAPPTLRPRRMVYPPPLAPVDAPPPASLGARAEHAPLAPPPRPASHAPSTPSTSSTSSTSSIDAPHDDAPARAYDDAAPPPRAPVVREHVARPAPSRAEPRAPAEPERAIERHELSPSVRARRELPRKNVASGPDPLALALAAAVQWASSDEPPAARPAPRAHPRAAPSRTPDAPPSHAADEAQIASPARARRSAIDTDDAPARTTALARTAPPPSRAAAPPPARAQPAPRADAAPEIHIGSVDVRIVHEPPPPAPAPAPAPAAPSGPLARSLTSPFGLRQG